jgi:hypothetical protein
MIALMQSTLPYLDADELFRLVPLPDALAALRRCFAASPSHVTAFTAVPAAGSSGDARSGRRGWREVGRIRP